MSKTIQTKDVKVKISNADHSHERFTNLEKLRNELLEAGMPKEKVDMFSYKLFKEGSFTSKSGMLYQIIVTQEEDIIRVISPCENCKTKCQAVCYQCIHNRSMKDVKVTGKNFLDEISTRDPDINFY